MKTIAKTMFLSGIRKKEIVQKRKNHTQSKLAKNLPKMLEESDSESDEQDNKPKDKQEELDPALQLKV